MAESPVEIVLFIRAKEEVTQVMNQVTEHIGVSMKELRNFGIGMVAAGGAATASLLGMAKSAMDQEVGINRLSLALKNAGGSYDSLKGNIESAISAIQNKTNYGDEEQRQALVELIGVTGTYEGALEQLQIAADLAAGKDMDLVSAATLVGRVATGNTELLARYGIQVKEGATATEVLADIQERFAGAAEAAADPLTQLKNLIGDLWQDIGQNLVPVLREVVSHISDVIKAVRGFIEGHSEMVNTLTLVAGGLGLVTTALGFLVIALSMSITAVRTLGTALKIGTGPIGWTILAIEALTAAGIVLYQNWDKVKNWFADLWDNIKIIFSEAVKFLVNTVLQPFFQYVDKVFGTILDALSKVVGFFNDEWGAAIKSAADTLHNLDDEIIAWADNLEEGARANKEARATVRDLEESLRAQEEAANSAGDAIKEYSDQIKLANNVDLKKTSAMISTVEIGGQTLVSPPFHYSSWQAAAAATGVSNASIDEASMEKLGSKVQESIKQGMASANITLEVDGKELASVISKAQYNSLISKR
jgi:hypothetical protein